MMRLLYTLECMLYASTVVVVVFLAQRLLDASMVARQQKEARMQCELVLDRTSGLMTKRQKWAMAAIVEKLNAHPEKVQHE